MNIWLEGVDGTGKTTLAAALGEALGVTPLYHVTHEQLPEGRAYNVIDRHAVITNRIYKKALPDRFASFPKIKPEELTPTANDLYVHIKYSGRCTPDYTPEELIRLNQTYCRFFASTSVLNQSRAEILKLGRFIELGDFTGTIPRRVRVTLPSPPDELTKEEETSIKVHEILKIVREMEYQRVANQQKRQKSIHTVTGESIP